MKRDIYNALKEWKTSSHRKPLLLQGARQTGKTYILKEFGSNEFENLIYCNFEEDPQLDLFFSNNLDPHRIISDLSIYMGKEIRPGFDLIFFDEIQTSNKALNSLKYFAENAGSYHVVSAGSLLGLKLSSPGSFPVGKVNFLSLFPMSFMEFLDAMGEQRYRVVLERMDTLEPFPEPFHNHLLDLLNKYYIIGGMPEAVRTYAETKDANRARKIQKEIIRSYIMDFAKHSPPHDIPKLTIIWESIPKHLAKENKKFVFNAVKKGARAREYENALKWLEDTGLIYRVSAVTQSKHPLKHYADAGCFKVYALDVGLLGAMSDTPVDLIVQGGRLYNEFEGAFVENYSAQQLTSVFDSPLYYWRSKGGKAELDFLIGENGRVYPLEVKAGINPKSWRLKSYDQQFSPERLLRANLLNLKMDGRTCNIPLYALGILPSLIQSALQINQ